MYRYRASLLQRLGFDDLAIGDTYKALLLLDDYLDESGEYHLQVCEAEANYIPDWSRERRVEKLSRRAHLICRELVDMLLTRRCLQSAYDFCMRSLRYGSLDPTETLDVFREKEEILRLGRKMQVEDGTLQLEALLVEATFDKRKLPDETNVARVIYPWNTFEPDRYSAANIAELNAELAKAAPKLEARITHLPLLATTTSTRSAATNGGKQSNGPSPISRQFGLFAKEAPTPGEEILSESSILTAHRQLHGELCDACSGMLPPIGSPSFACPDCADATFCSQECLDAALESYHPAVCDTDANTVARNALPTEAADSLYFLLVARTLAMAEHQGVHPLQLKETRFLWGDFGAEAKLPWSFKWNVLYPLHVLEKMDVNVFEHVRRYDFWVFNTLYAKFRGVASGRVNPRDGVPEVCAVHPLWSLANHSCAPNVRWEWGGNIRFWTRTAAEVVRWGPMASSMGGVCQDEEIFSHYGDIDLDVKERREWMRGALGGDCQCERCRWEERQLPKTTTGSSADAEAAAAMETLALSS